MNMLTWILLACLAALLAFHMYQMHIANKALSEFNEHHEQLHAKLKLADYLIETAEPIIKDCTSKITDLELEKLTLQTRIDSLSDEVELLEERTHSTINDQMLRVAKELREGKATLDEASSEIIKLSDKLLKADRQNVSIQRVVSEQEQIIEQVTAERDGFARELAENREAADHAGDDLMAVVDATRNDG